MEGISILTTLFLDAGQPLFPVIKDVANLFLCSQSDDESGELQ